MLRLVNRVNPIPRFPRSIPALSSTSINMYRRHLNITGKKLKNPEETKNEKNESLQTGSFQEAAIGKVSNKALETPLSKGTFFSVGLNSETIPTIDLEESVEGKGVDKLIGPGAPAVK